MYQKLCMERFRRIATIEADKFNAEIGEENLLILMGGLSAGCGFVNTFRIVKALLR